jgi:hypothetical protein
MSSFRGIAHILRIAAVGAKEKSATPRSSTTAFVPSAQRRSFVNPKLPVFSSLEDAMLRGADFSRHRAHGWAG